MKSRLLPGLLLALCFLAFNALAQNSSRPQLPAKPAGKIGAVLQQLYNENRGDIFLESEVLGHYNPDLILVQGDKIRIEATAVKDGQALAFALRQRGAEEISVFQLKVNAWLPIKSIPSLNDMEALRFAEVVYKPAVNIGSVDSQADSAMAVKQARQDYCVDGSGVNLGIMSDSYNDLGGAAAGVASGDLPGAGNPNGYTTPVTVVRDANGSDEGRAMAELAHDLAPGAALFFASAFYGQATFASDIIDLGNVHKCDVIVDDIIYFEEPMYMDGIIAQAADKVHSQGVDYFSSAGNSGQDSYEAAYNGYSGAIAEWHDFDPGGGVDTLQSITVNGGSAINLVLQWDDPWGSLTPNSPATDLDIYLLDSAGNTVLAGSARDNPNVTLEPTEFLSYTAPMGSPVTYTIAIVRFSGPSPAAMKWAMVGASGLVINDFPPTTVNAQATCYGHANAAGANAVGACAWFQSPAYGVDPPVAEPFTSSGGVQIRYDTNGVAITPITRDKPEFTGIDGVSNTFFGNSNFFFGTSAAAPNVAAVACLMLEADSNLTPAQVTGILANSAIDMNTAGFDYLTGDGLVQADSALAQVFDGLCIIHNITVVNPPTFEPGDSSYTVELAVAFSGAICSDSLEVNGQRFAISSHTDTQNVVLTELPADGQSVDVTASFVPHASCSLTVPALFTALSAAADTLVITEIMYNPPESGTDSLEFIEIYNPSATPVDLSGYYFSQGVTFTFGSVVLAPGDYVVVCEDSSALFSQFAASGYEWSGALSNTGEAIVLKNNSGTTVDSVRYDDSSPWPTAANGGGPSLVLCDVTSDNALGSNWQASASSTGNIINGNELKGSPGTVDQACLPCVNDSTFITDITCDSNQVDTTVVILTNNGGCDSVVTTYTVLDPGSTTPLAALSICQGDSVLIFGTYQTVAGTYFDTLANVNGCDSILSRELQLNPVYQTVLAPVEICEGDSALIYGQWQSVAAVYYDSLQTIAGCDSVLLTSLMVNPSYEDVLTPIGICQGDSALIFGSWRSTAGTFYDSLSTVDGCDSVLVQELMINPFYKEVLPPTAVCEGDSVLIFGSYRDTAGIYYDTLQTVSGCDSVLCKELIVDSLIITAESRAICEGDSSLIFGMYQTVPGLYSDTSQSAAGCDSVHNITLLLLPTYYDSLPPIEICVGDSALVFGNWQNSSGLYYDSLLTVDGCDSILAQELIVRPEYIIPFPPKFICEGDSILVFGEYVTGPGAYYDSLQTIYGCDSVLIETIIINPVFQAPTDTLEICEGDSVSIYGMWQGQAGLYYDSLITSLGCDSILSTELIVNPVDTVFQNTVTNDSTMAGVFDTTYTNQYGCDSTVITTVIYQPGPCVNLDSTFINAVTCDSAQAGTTITVFIGSDGCDSVVTTTTIYDPGTLTTLSPLSICEGDSVLIFGLWQELAGNYYDSLSNVNGCDSVLQQLLIVNPVDTVYQNTVTNDSTMAGVFDTTYTNQYGCDSTVITTIIYQAGPCASLDSTFITAVTCDSSQVGVKVSIYVGSDGCDSVVTLTTSFDPGSLTLLPPLEICAGDSVLIFGNWQSLAGSYYDSLLNVNGCDSVLQQDLQLRPVVFVNLMATICDGDSIFLEGSWQFVAGSYYDTLVGPNGCDSVLITMLTVDTSPGCFAQDSLICVSDSSWRKSTVITPSNKQGFWGGVSSLPADATFSLFATIGQPYPWGGLKLVEGSQPITSLENIRYFKKKFNLSDPTGYNARIQMYMDDGTEIYINGHWLVREENMDTENRKGLPHDLVIEKNNSVTNGYAGHDMFDASLSSVDLDTVLQSGENEILVVLRNPAGGHNVGGFSFRMELNRNMIPNIPTKQQLEDRTGELQVYPNPGHSAVNVLLPYGLEGQATLTLSDMGGRNLLQQQVNPELREIQLDLSDLPPGVYKLGYRSAGFTESLILLLQ